VAEETGWGVVPAYTAGRLFRDRLGDLTRQTAAIVNQAYLVVAGYAIDLKQVGSTIQP
jgi:adenosylcobinamide kinase/adenosylcobinamide-phosphate guanylyltransferase